MKTKLIELETSKKLLEEVLHTTYTQLINNVEHAINNLIVDSHDAKLLRKWIRNDDKGLYLCFEVGFYNDVEQRIDFGSDVSFYYSVERGLEVNYGTIGMYSKKNM